MKPIYKLLFAVGMLTTVVYTPAPAQKPVLAGFVFANAVGVDGRADVTANGRKLTRQGLEQGMATSGLGMPIGNYEVQVTAPGCEPAKASIQVQVGATPVLVAFVEHVSDPRTNAVKHFVRLRQYPAVPQENNYLFNIVSVDPTVRVTATGGGQTQNLEPFKPLQLSAKTVTITDSLGANTEAKVDEKGSYYCFAFRRADGKPGYSLVPQRIYQW